jgi:hypothetical protein
VFYCTDRARVPPKTRFAPDSPLEGERFEPLVPRKIATLSRLPFSPRENRLCCQRHLRCEHFSLRHFKQNRLPCAPVRNVSDVRHDRQVNERGMLEWIEHDEIGRIVSRRNCAFTIPTEWWPY